jgi:hypothetical protein
MSDDEGNAVIVGVVGVSNGSLLIGLWYIVDTVGAGGSSLARGGTNSDCEPPSVNEVLGGGGYWNDDFVCIGGVECTASLCSCVASASPLPGGRYECTRSCDPNLMAGLRGL